MQRFTSVQCFALGRGVQDRSSPEVGNAMPLCWGPRLCCGGAQAAAGGWRDILGASSELQESLALLRIMTT